jgi:hypothetical protein
MDGTFLTDQFLAGSSPVCSIRGCPLVGSSSAAANSFLTGFGPGLWLLLAVGEVDDHGGVVAIDGLPCVLAVVKDGVL